MGYYDLSSSPFLYHSNVLNDKWDHVDINEDENNKLNPINEKIEHPVKKDIYINTMDDHTKIDNLFNDHNDNSDNDNRKTTLGSLHKESMDNNSTSIFSTHKSSVDNNIINNAYNYHLHF